MIDEDYQQSLLFPISLVRRAKGAWNENDHARRQRAHFPHLEIWRKGETARGLWCKNDYIFLFCNNTKNLKIRNFWKKKTKQTKTLDSGKNIIHVASLPVYCIQKQGVHLLLLF